MPFTGKATYSAGADLPELVDDLKDLVSIVSPHETPLLDALGDAARPARSTVHEWIEDAPLPNSDTVTGFTAPNTIEVSHVTRFRVYDLVRLQSGSEVMRVEAINEADDALTVTRSFGDSTAGDDPASGDTLTILGNPTLEGADAAPARFTSRTRSSNTTQIFAATVEVSGSELAVNHAGVEDEFEYQKAMRLNELLRDLEHSVINGVQSPTPTGSATEPRSMRGLLASIVSQRFTPGTNGFPADTTLTEAQLNLALRSVWEAGGTPNLIVVGGRQKRAINTFVASNRRYFNSTESYRDMVGAYESDFGVCRVVLCRAVPQETVMLLDSRKISVVPLAGRSFHFKKLARTGDRETGQLVGEYTLELRNESCHGVITGLSGA